jgi:hypothetical protein
VTIVGWLESLNSLVVLWQDKTAEVYAEMSIRTPADHDSYDDLMFSKYAYKKKDTKSSWAMASSRHREVA